MATSLVFLVLGFFAIQASAQEGSNSPVVAVEQIFQKPNIRTHTTVGTAKAAQIAAVQPDTDGRVEQVLAKSSQKVARGQVLFRLETSRQTLAVAKAKVALKAAERAYARYLALSKRGAATAIQKENAELARDTAKLALREAEVALQRRIVMAPFAGIVDFVDLHRGDHVTTSTVITRVIDNSSMRVDFVIPEDASGSLQAGDQVPIVHMSGQGNAMAEVTAIAPSIDAVARTRRVRATIINPPEWMAPGMSFRVSVEVIGQSYPVVPEAAILWGSRGAYIWKVEDGRARRRPVTVVKRHEGNVWIRADLAEGAWIITEGVQKVREGRLIRVANPQKNHLVADRTENANPGRGAGNE